MILLRRKEDDLVRVAGFSVVSVTFSASQKETRWNEKILFAKIGIDTAENESLKASGFLLQYL